MITPTEPTTAPTTGSNDLQGPRVPPPSENASEPLKRRRESPKDDGSEGLRGDRSTAQRARDGLRAAREAGSHYRQDFSMSSYWNELAKERGIRLPQWHTAPTKANIRRWLRTLGISVDQFREWSCLELDEFSERNPAWPMRALLGDILEWNRDEWIANGRPDSGHKNQ